MSRTNLILCLITPLLALWVACQAPLETRDAGVVAESVLLTSQGGHKYNPVWSPNGSRIYFQERFYNNNFLRHDVPTSTYDTVLTCSGNIYKYLFDDEGKSVIFQIHEIDENNQTVYHTFWGNFEDGSIEFFPLDVELLSTDIWDGNNKRLFRVECSESTCRLEVRYQDGQIAGFSVDSKYSFYSHPKFSVSPEGDSFLYYTQTTDTSGIWLATTESLLLIAGNTDSIRYYNPAWSPVGDSFLYTSNNIYTGKRELIMASYNDHSSQILMDEFNYLERIKWAHDGTKVFIYGMRDSTGYSSWVYSFGQDTFDVATEYISPSGYSWFPEEQIEIDNSYTSYLQFSWYDLATQKYHRLSDMMKTNYPYHFDLTQESDLIFSDGSTLYQMSVDQGIISPVITALSLNLNEIRNCDLSPTGDRVAFDNNYEIYIYNLNSQELEYPTKELSSSRYYYPTWSPDEKHLASFNYDYNSRNWNVSVLTFENMDQNFENKLSVNSCYSESWSPEIPGIGSYLMYTNADGVQALNTQTWQSFTIIDSEDIQGDYIQAAWSPDGSQIALIVDYTQLWIYDFYKDLKN